jgi:hypothetical protein
MNGTSMAVSAKFGTFAAVFAISATVLYVLCDMLGFTLFTYHPATGRFEWGYTQPRRGEGPVMYWYGWVVMTLLGASVLGGLATVLPDRVARKMPLVLVWLVPVLAIPPLFYSLMSFWTR